ncbi:Zinc ion binding protein [Phytophthora palmivora]|uniref:phytol kinase n=1 Tax=Phytophthora palmivora TaxID=4796 RepID=A0A2P4XXV5_9STRA|nr:Zinc ion binding protein [Phytophthora palmivora]
MLRDVLERKPAAGFDEVSVALTQNELGGVLRQLGELDEALELLNKALEVRDRSDEKAGISLALRDGNLTRDEIAKVYEAKGDCVKALEVRQPGKRICGNEACEALDYQDGKLLACTRCKCIFYCGKTCQKQDWKNRHKLLCQSVKKVDDS